MKYTKVEPQQYLEELLLTVAQQGASDLHISPGNYPILRIDSRLVPLTNKKILDKETLDGLVLALLGDKKERFLAEKEIDFSYDFQQKARFRVNVYFTEGQMASALRFIPDKILSIEELNLPDIIKIFTKLSQGLVLVVGPNGHGKSTSLAAMIEMINAERAEKIITVEDPIEYIFTPQKSLVDQRELYSDTLSFHKAIRAATRQNVNVIMVGEMRDYETMSATLTAAETGHLIFATLHTNSASQTVERIIYSFPPNQQNQARAQLASTISGVISQRLIPRIKGGLIPAVEVMIATPAVRALINDNKIGQLDLVIETSMDQGMISLDHSLSNLVRKKEITLEQAEFYSLNPSQLKNLI